jgi:hypothetical protein
MLPQQMRFGLLGSLSNAALRLSGFGQREFDPSWDPQYPYIVTCLAVIGGVRHPLEKGTPRRKGEIARGRSQALNGRIMRKHPTEKRGVL